MRETFRLDGAEYFGDPREKIIGPAPEEIAWANSLRSEKRVVEVAEKSSGLKIPVADFIPDSFKGWFKKHKMPTTIGGVLLSGVALAGVGPCSDGNDERRSAVVQANLGYKLSLPVAPGRTVWFSGGPHADGYSGEDDTAFDLLLSPQRIPCDGNGEDIYRGEPVRAIADGEVLLIGDEADRNDKYHSVLKIKHDEGLVSGSMHLSGMSEFNLKVGDIVTQGDPVGYVSCEFPRGGSTSGAHGHFWLEDENEEAISLDRLVLSGWQIKAGDEPFEGTMTTGDVVRVAHEYRCGPPPKSTAPCDGDRNDIAWNEPGVVLPTRTSIPRPTRTPIPTIALVETVGPKFEPISPPKSMVTVSPTPETVSPPRNSDEPSGFLVLDGRGDALRIRNSESLRLDGDFTIEARVKADGYGTIFAKGERREQAAFFYGFWKCSDTTVGNAAAALLGGVGRYCSDQVISEEGFVDAAMVRRGDTVQIIVNGEVILSAEAPGNVSAVKEDSFVGNSPVPINEYLNGQLDAIRVYTAGKTVEEIADDFENFESTLAEPGLVLNMPFDGDTLDYSGFGNHGELLGDAHVVR